MQTNFLKYLVVGSGTAIIYFLSLGITSFFFGGVSFSPVAISYLLAITFNYLANYKWTFVASVGHNLAVGKYLVMVSIGGILNASVVSLGLGLKFNFFLVQMVAIAVICFFNYFMSRKWVYVSS